MTAARTQAWCGMTRPRLANLKRSSIHLYTVMRGGFRLPPMLFLSAFTAWTRRGYLLSGKGGCPRTLRRANVGNAARFSRALFSRQHQPHELPNHLIAYFDAVHVRFRP